MTENIINSHPKVALPYLRFIPKRSQVLVASNATSPQSNQSHIHLLAGRGGKGRRRGAKERETGKKGKREMERADSLSAHDKRSGEDDERDNN